MRPLKERCAIVTFTTFEPDDDVCAFEGAGSLYALYYKTGAAYYVSIVGYDDDTMTVGTDTYKKISKSVSLGHGVAATPSLHVGREQGAKIPRAGEVRRQKGG